MIIFLMLKLVMELCENCLSIMGQVFLMLQKDFVAENKCLVQMLNRLFNSLELTHYRIKPVILTVQRRLQMLQRVEKKFVPKQSHIELIYFLILLIQQVQRKRYQSVLKNLQKLLSLFNSKDSVKYQNNQFHTTLQILVFNNTKL